VLAIAFPNETNNLRKMTKDLVDYTARYSTKHVIDRKSFYLTSLESVGMSVQLSPSMRLFAYPSESHTLRSMLLRSSALCIFDP